MTILSVLMEQQHHAKEVEQHFIFLHAFLIYKLWGYKPLYPHGLTWAAPSEVARSTR
jgi:hypothetical protein